MDAVEAKEGVYVGIGGGATFLNDSGNTRPASPDYDLSSSGIPSLDVTSSTDGGFSVNGVLGYAITNGVRVEGEVGYRENGLDTSTAKSPGALILLLPRDSRYDPDAQKTLLGERDINGDVSAITVMVNGFYDIDVGSGLKPYIGGGVGVAFFSIEAISATTGRTLVDDTGNTVFAYQVGGGLGYEMTPTTTLSLDYRYFGTQDPSVKGELTPREFETEYGGHFVGVSIRFWPFF